MHSRTVEQVRSWDSRPFSGGLGTLYELSENDHTGAVVADDAWLFMLNGRVIGIFEGTMDDFEASGTVYSTPNDALPLLFSMQEREGRTRAKYFTEETPLEEADQTLADANFTGYIELSENVLSGDYYLVYYGGTRRSAAFIGQSERVETGDAAFEKAAEEVGLYEVKDVSMTITEIPEPKARSADTEHEAAPGPDAETEAEAVDEPEDIQAPPDTTAETAVASATGTAQPDESAVPEESETDGDRTEQAEAPETAPPADPDTTTPSTETTGAATDTTQDTGEAESVPEPEEPESERSASSGAESTEGQPPAESGESGTGSLSRPESRAGSTSRAAQRETSAESDGAEAGADTEDSELEKRFRAEAEWRRTRAIPALDPDQTEPTDESSESTGESRRSLPTGEPSQSKTRSRSDTQAQKRDSGTTARGSPGKEGAAKSTAGSTSTPERAGSTAGSHPASGNRGQKLETALEKREEQIETLESQLATVESQRSDLEADLDDERAERSRLESELADLREERDQLESRVEELAAAVERSDSTADSGTPTLDPASALAGTNLFVRYASKGQPTLEALGPEIDPGAVNENLQLEHHTQFETDGLQVDSRPFREFLESTGEFRFVSWVLRELPYELLETGNRNALGALFEAISAIDRIEFEGSVTVDAESGTDREFAIVMRDRMGNPLVLGEYNEGRNPVQGAELETLLDGAREVAASVDTLAGAFYVTASFFEPAALENAEEAASTGGLFSRQEKASYVTPDSGTGFHLGLVEDRSQAFHVTVPKL